MEVTVQVVISARFGQNIVVWFFSALKIEGKRFPRKIISLGKSWNSLYHENFCELTEWWSISENTSTEGCNYMGRYLSTFWTLVLESFTKKMRYPMPLPSLMNWFESFGILIIMISGILVTAGSFMKIGRHFVWLMIRISLFGGFHAPSSPTQWTDW